MAYAFPRVRIITTAVDKRINEEFHIIPGIGEGRPPPTAAHPHSPTGCHLTVLKGPVLQSPHCPLIPQVTLGTDTSAPTAPLPGARVTAWTAELAGHGATTRAGYGASPPASAHWRGSQLPACATHLQQRPAGPHLMGPSLPASSLSPWEPSLLRRRRRMAGRRVGWREGGMVAPGGRWGVSLPRSPARQCRWCPCSQCRAGWGWSPPSLGRRGTGSGALDASSGPGWGCRAGVCIYLYLLGAAAPQLLENHQGLGIASRNHLVPTDVTLRVTLRGPLGPGRRCREGRGCLDPQRPGWGGWGCLIFKRSPRGVPVPWGRGQVSRGVKGGQLGHHHPSCSGSPLEGRQRSWACAPPCWLRPQPQRCPLPAALAAFVLYPIKEQRHPQGSPPAAASPGPGTGGRRVGVLPPPRGVSPWGGGVTVGVTV